MPEAVAALKAKHPDDMIEVWASDEHRLGLQPLLRRIWAPKGCRPVCLVEPRFEWLYLYGFVQPDQGRTHFLCLPKVNTAAFNQALGDFAAQHVCPAKQILLVIDGASWHRSQAVAPPPGVHLLLLPPYSPELQPAERLWPLTNEAIANQHFKTIDALATAQTDRCNIVQAMQADIQALTSFHWWLDATLS